MPLGASESGVYISGSLTASDTAPSERDVAESASSLQATDDWSKEKDPNKRRRIQNKLAQMKFRES